MQTWELWYPKAAAAGLSFARARIDPTGAVLVHACPPVLTVTVYDEQGHPVAEGVDLEATQESPITRLVIHEGNVSREDIWPGGAEMGMVVLLPGGEAGILLDWWNAADQSEWRWQVEFYNHR